MAKPIDEEMAKWLKTEEEDSGDLGQEEEVSN